MSSLLPLNGRRIAVTRARDQAPELTAKLAALGAEVIELPLINPELFVRVGAMDIKSFGKASASDGIRAEQSVIIVGDRRDIQLRSIEMGVRLLVITGNLPAETDIVQAAAARGYATATDLADYLVKKGLPFRDAHEVVAHAVKSAQALGIELSALSLDALRGFNPSIEPDVFEVLSLNGSLQARNTVGGTAPQQVQLEIARHRQRLL
jgi:hypothetical protein